MQTVVYPLSETIKWGEAKLKAHANKNNPHFPDSLSIFTRGP